MASLLLVLAVIAAATLWIRGTRANRQRWLKQLNLPGVWHSDDSGQRLTLEFRGQLDQGSYSQSSAGDSQQGSWRLNGSDLIFSPEGSSRVVRDGQQAHTFDQEIFCALTFFDPGRIGLNGSLHAHRVFDKSVDNVVPLRQRRDR